MPEQGSWEEQKGRYIGLYTHGRPLLMLVVQSVLVNATLGTFL